MRLRSLFRYAHEVRRALLPGRHPVHRLRPGNRLLVSVGRGARFRRHGRARRHGHFPFDPGGGLRVRVEEGGLGMGLAAPTAETPDAAVTQRGVVTTTVDSLVNW